MLIIKIALGIVLGVILLCLFPFIFILLGYLLLMLVPILLVVGVVVLLMNYFPVISESISSMNSDDLLEGISSMNSDDWGVVILLAVLVIILFLASTEFWYKKN